LSDNTDAGIEDPGGQGRPAPRMSARLVRIVSVVLAIVLVLAAGAAVWMALKARSADDQKEDRARAVSVASQFALRVDTFDGKDIEAYSKSIQEMLTTKYKSEFDKQFGPFKQVYEQAQAVGTGKVLMAGVASYDDDSATVLVVHDGSVKSKLGQSQVRHQRWTVNLVKVRDRWLVDAFTPVN
jgi:Mce-associated membrane protein